MKTRFRRVRSTFLSLLLGLMPLWIFLVTKPAAGFHEWSIGYIVVATILATTQICFLLILILWIPYLWKEE